MTALFDLQDVVYAPAGRTVLSIPALRIEKGQHTLIVGPSGSGKTTLLHVLSGLIHAGQGRVFVMVKDITPLSQGARDALRGQQMGFVFQGFQLIRTLSVRDNITLPLRAGKRPIEQAHVMAVAQKLGIAALLDQPVLTISQGEAQRCAIARAIIHAPPIILADEPSSALDDANAKAMMDLLITQAQETGATLILSTHDERVRTHAGFRTLRLEGGRVC